MKSIEVSKSHEDRKKSGFYDRFMTGRGLDIGYKGLGLPEGMEPVLPNAIGVDLDYPGYDGLNLPFPTGSQDYIFASHCLEHISDYRATLIEWHRVLTINGYMVLILPHAYLYERAFTIPGSWNSCADHKRIYTPARLLREIEESLLPNSYRIEHMKDNDKNFNYDKEPESRPAFYMECFEFELVIRKIRTPIWKVAY